jgi:prefoldin subunit 5
MFEAMALEVKMNEALQIVDKNIQFLAEQLDKSNKRIAELENQVVILTDRVNYLYDEPLP